VFKVSKHQKWAVQTPNFLNPKRLDYRMSASVPPMTPRECSTDCFCPTPVHWRVEFSSIFNPQAPAPAPAQLIEYPSILDAHPSWLLNSNL